MYRSMNFNKYMPSCNDHYNKDLEYFLRLYLFTFRYRGREEERKREKH